MSTAPEASPLGKAVAYAEHYDPALLFPIPRQGKRAEIGIAEGALPFVGEDIWNAYELSWLDPRGKPVVALAHFIVPATSPNLIESKSLKLYLNSFNQTRLAGVDELVATLTRDLSAAAGAPVLVHVAPLSTRPQRPMGYPKGILLDGLEIDVDLYTPEPALLSADTSRAPVTETLYSHLLKSNCLVTGQPDWAMLVVRYTGAPIDREGLLRYIISFRQHNEFHEQCVERVFVDILRQCQPSALSVFARYTRRGGLDINPYRRTPGTAVPAPFAEIRQ
ncbi:NADPH-dependent 7-cyano-7-deazaguanine reductase [Zoogloea ramigera]|jgi:7-cyano-7-deazaguanine reductase|uniref:NADPH-dependent 7-cyano-7-deazaguanine reductase n=1 Tax=Zoogloea ramigera TaxID=350 RepID=A0A4Y4CZH2_ZOORA|nr:NADPH-dependent 7-cyano-7-deazaguanine reductase QueF [Zoogloea ramigera]GEC95950.1 NADPH-dependent 7-cyano-7-deazaguanine reductase [Zoogloea ramigera]